MAAASSGVPRLCPLKASRWVLAPGPVLRPTGALASVSVTGGLSSWSGSPLLSLLIGSASVRTLWKITAELAALGVGSSSGDCGTRNCRGLTAEGVGQGWGGRGRGGAPGAAGRCVALEKAHTCAGIQIGRNRMWKSFSFYNLNWKVSISG